MMYIFRYFNIFQSFTTHERYANDKRPRARKWRVQYFGTAAWTNRPVPNITMSCGKCVTSDKLRKFYLISKHRKEIQISCVTCLLHGDVVAVGRYAAVILKPAFRCPHGDRWRYNYAAHVYYLIQTEVCLQMLLGCIF